MEKPTYWGHSGDLCDSSSELDSRGLRTSVMCSPGHPSLVERSQHVMEQSLMRETFVRGRASRILENMVGPDAGMLACFLCTDNC